MISSTSLVTAPSTEPITLAEAKEHLREDASDQDAYIASLIAAARKKVEHDAWRVLVTQTWDVFYDSFPALSCDPLVLPRPPLVSVTSVKYHDADGATATTLSSSSYIVDAASQPGRIQLHDGEEWPSDTLRPANGVEVRIVAGYGSASAVPEHLKQAIYLLLGNWYENRESTIAGTIISAIPLGYHDLIFSEEALRFA